MAGVIGNTMHVIVSLVFLAMAYFNYLQPSPLCTVPGPLGFLSSMWFMYVLMAFAHGGVWLALLRKGISCDCSGEPDPAPPPVPTK
jgi:hypothetical protein